MRISGIAVLAAGLVLAASASAEAPSVDAARQLFERYVALGQAFDPAAADLYSDDALIRNQRTYPDGSVRELTVPAEKYKTVVRAVMPLARQRGDRNTYSDVSYAVEGARVRISAMRFSELKNTASPLSLLVGPSPGGGWLIYEEYSESRP